MTTKKVATLILMLFLISSTVVIISKVASDNLNTNSTRNEDLPENVDVVYYFYTNYRCETCELIEQYTGEAVKSNFANELSNGKIIWKAVNTDEKQNQHFLDDYQLYTKSVVLVKIRDGKEISWKNLEEVWDLVDDETAFKTFVTDEVKKFLESN